MLKISRIALTILAVAIIAYALVPIIFHMRSSGGLDSEILNSGFETGDLRSWIKTGNAFDHQPTLGDNTSERGREGSAHQGEWWIGGFENYQGKEGQEPGETQGDEPTGTLASVPFIIYGDRISFLIGGGHHPWVKPDGDGSVCVNLLVDGEVVRTATGDDNEAMKQRIWNVSGFKGKEASIQIVDRNTDGWGHINFDHVLQTTKWHTERGNLVIYLWVGAMLLFMAFGASKQNMQ